MSLFMSLLATLPLPLPWPPPAAAPLLLLLVPAAMADTTACVATCSGARATRVNAIFLGI
jgi:hypothetical protein